jgi:hypothetical protein
MNNRRTAYKANANVGKNAGIFLFVEISFRNHGDCPVCGHWDHVRDNHHILAGSII